MPEQQLKAFLEAIKSDTALQARVITATDLDAVIAIAKEAGFALGKEDVMTLQAQRAEEMNDAELADVAGGADGIMGAFRKLLEPLIRKDIELTIGDVVVTPVVKKPIR
jgi:predicted ribosomally synthesized peptide with nif11-like leader